LIIWNLDVNDVEKMRKRLGHHKSAESKYPNAMRDVALFYREGKSYCGIDQEEAKRWALNHKNAEV
jgi:phenylalanyl-tRNA synthetase beta subunit